MTNEQMVSNGYDVYNKINGELQYHENMTKEQALQYVNANQLNYNRQDMHDMRFKLVHQTESHAIFKE